MLRAELHLDRAVVGSFQRCRQPAAHHGAHRRRRNRRDRRPTQRLTARSIRSSICRIVWSCSSRMRLGMKRPGTGRRADRRHQQPRGVSRVHRGPGQARVPRLGAGAGRDRRFRTCDVPRPPLCRRARRRRQRTLLAVRDHPRPEPARGRAARARDRPRAPRDRARTRSRRGARHAGVSAHERTPRA